MECGSFKRTRMPIILYKILQIDWHQSIFHSSDWNHDISIAHQMWQGIYSSLPKIKCVFVQFSNHCAITEIDVHATISNDITKPQKQILKWIKCDLMFLFHSFYSIFSFSYSEEVKKYRHSVNVQ